MGLIADFFVATPDEARRYASMDEDDWVASRALERLEMKGLTGLSMGLLEADLLGVPWDVEKHMLRNVARPDPESEETWAIDVFSADYVALLVDAPATRIESAAAAWRAREEMEGWREAEVLEFLQDLRRLAASARDQGKRLYLYNCA